MTKLNPSYKSVVDVAILSGKSNLPLHNFRNQRDFNIKKLQKAIRQHAKSMNSKVSTRHDKLYDELVILRKGPAKNYQPGVIAEVIGQEVPSLQNRAFEYVPSSRKTKSLSYEFKVGDSGTLFCGEPYVVLEKKRNGELLVNVKSKGSWKIGLRKSDGTCVYDYPNKHRFALLPPVQTGATTRLFLKEFADLTERYGGVNFYYTTDDDGIHLELLSESIECRVGFDTSPKRLREVANFLV